MASGSGMPARVIDASKRVNRSMTANRIVIPRTGTRSNVASRSRRPDVERMPTKYPAAAAIRPATRSHHQLPRKAVAASRSRVGSGSLASRPEKKSLNFGRTKTARTTTVPADITATIAG